MLREYSFHSVTLIVWHCDINCEVWKWTQALESDQAKEGPTIQAASILPYSLPPTLAPLHSTAHLCCTLFQQCPLWLISTCSGLMDPTWMYWERPCSQIHQFESTLHRELQVHAPTSSVRVNPKPWASCICPLCCSGLYKSHPTPPHPGQAGV